LNRGGLRALGGRLEGGGGGDRRLGLAPQSEP